MLTKKESQHAIQNAKLTNIDSQQLPTSPNVQSKYKERYPEALLFKMTLHWHLTANHGMFRTRKSKLTAKTLDLQYV